MNSKQRLSGKNLRLQGARGMNARPQRSVMEPLERRQLLSAAVSEVDLSTYVRVGRFDLPEPTRTAAPANSLLAQEASAVTYDWDTDTLFVVGDGGTSVVQVTKTGQLINSMTLAPGGSPQGTDFFDTEGVSYVGGGKFVLLEERDRQANLFTYVPGGVLHKTDVQTAKLGTTVGNIGLEGVSYDPLSGGYIFVKEKDPESIFQTSIDFTTGLSTNGSATATSSSDLFNPALANLADFSDVFALSNLPSLAGQADFSHLLVISQESGQIINVDRAGSVSSRLTITADPGSPLSVADMTMEGVTMDRDGNLYVANENGGGDANHPQLWVYAHSGATDLAPTAITLPNKVTSIPENTSTATPVKVSDIAITDDGLGVNNLSLTGTDAGFFQVIGSALYLKAGTTLNSTTKPSYSLTVNVDDPNAGGSPDASVNYSLAVSAATGGAGSLIISEVAPWSSGNGTLGADWFEITNVGTATQSLSGWTMDDDSSAPNIAPLSGVANIAPGESAIFIELGTGHTAAGDALKFRSLWPSAPATLKIGSYAGSGVGLSTGGDQVNLFNGLVKMAGVTFGGATTTSPFKSFDNAAGLNWNGVTNAAISSLSAVGVNGATSIPDTLSTTNNTPVTVTGSPGTIGAPPTPVITILATDANAAEAGADPGKFRISRTGSTVSPLTISYTIATGAGQAASDDYTPALTGTATIPSGQAFVDLTVTPIEDNFIEGNETVTLTLGDSGSADVGAAATATVTIVDKVVAPFLGVSSGDANASSAVLWTRVNRQANEPVTAQVSTDPAFGGTLLTFAGTSDSTKDYTAKVTATGLTSGTRYYYRFVNTATNEISGTGTFKTSPAADAQAPLKFAFSGDMDGLMRPYPLSSQLPSEGLDFYANLGDVIYETASNAAGNNGASYLNSPSVALSGSSSTLNGVPTSTGFATQQQLFDDYNRKYREQFLPVNTPGQNGLQDFYAGQGNYTLADNHELGNRQYINGGAPAGGSVGGAAGTNMPTGRGVDARDNGTGNPGNVNDTNSSTSDYMNQSQGFQTLQQDFLNYQPINEGRATATVLPGDNRTGTTKQLFFSQPWGTNAVYVQTDTRSYRDLRLKTANGAADDTGARADNPNRTYLGATQLAWLEQQLLTAEQNGTPWKFVTVSDPIDEIGPIGSSLSSVTNSAMQPFSGNSAYAPVNADGGKSYIGGYRAERNALLKFIADHKIENVVFLATDDHQNRINEVTYSPTGQTGVQSSYVPVPHVFSIVCGPLGATGPDLFLNHDFTSVQGAANLIANAQSAAGVEPIGLMGYSGLHDVKRDEDGTLVAEATPQAADFYSPDTFNYNVLQVGADGKTLTVTSKGIKSTAQNAAAEYGANGNTVRTLFSFQVDAFNEAPVAKPSSVTTNEDTAKTFAVTDFGFTDVENNALASITVSNLVLAGGDTLTVNQGAGAVAVSSGMTITAAQIPTLTYTPAANGNGAARSTFDFTVNDASGPGVATATMTINVTAINDKPVLTVPGAQTTAEDVAVKITGISVSDVDALEGTGATKVTLSVASGKLTVSTAAAGGLTAATITGNGTGAVVLQGPIAQVNATLAAGVTYLGNLNFNGPVTLSIAADDLGNTGVGGPLTDSRTISIVVLSPTQQVARLQSMVGGLFSSGAINGGQNNALTTKLGNVQSAIDGGKTSLAYNVLGAFRNQILDVLTSPQRDPILAAVDALLQSLKIGGGF